MELVPIPPFSEKQLTAYIERTLQDAVASGLTSIHDAGASPEVIRVFKKLSEQGKIPVITASVSFTSIMC